MAISIRLNIDVTDDFHIGTGSGRGRATDAVVLVDEHGVPFIPGSVIKGLCKWHARRLIAAYPSLTAQPPASGELLSEPAPILEIFGGGSDLKYADRRVWFDHAHPADPLKNLRTLRTGRSARDRVSGRAREQHLFFYEDAAPATFTTLLTCEDDLSPAALVLLLTALRRIEALGGQRRRGKGRCRCTVEVIDPGSVTELAGLVLPSRDETRAASFRKLARSLLDGSAAAAIGSAPSDPLPEPAASASANRSVTGQACWLVFGYADSPLTLGHDQAVENTIQSDDFISGARLRGALAWQALRAGLLPDSLLFQEAFVRERLHFGPLYPAPAGWNVRSLPMPMPASFHTCKRSPGSRSFDAADAHGVLDRFHTGQETCATCGAALKPAGGYCQLEGEPDEATLLAGRPPIHVFQRTAIDETTGRAKDGSLYSLESVQRGIFFGGYVWGPGDLLEELLGERCDTWTTVRVGKAKSRGQGLLKVCLQRNPAGSHLSFPGILPEIWRPGGSTPHARARERFFVTLYSDLIAVDSLLRPITRLTEEELWRLIGGKGPVPFELDRGFSSIRRVGGFIGVAGLPRSADLALAAGSTWRLQWRDLDQDLLSAAHDRLLQAQAAGIGLRRGEGFGRFIIDLPVHVAGWDDMIVPSRQVEFGRMSFPYLDTGQQAKRDPGLWLFDQFDPAAPPRPDQDETYRRLFAELAQKDDPVAAAQALLRDPLRRSGKAADLEEKLKQLGFEADRAHLVETERFRNALWDASGEGPRYVDA